MRPNHLTRALCAVVAVLGLTGVVFPQVASAFYSTGGYLAHGDPICIHRACCYEQVHSVHLHAGVTYTITLSSNQFDTYLFLEHSNGQLITWNDDFPGLGTNSRIYFTPSYTGTYNLCVSSYHQYATGNYSVTVSP